jgi:tetrahydromethanopterin S-methyltransferase subunit A
MAFRLKGGAGRGDALVDRARCLIALEHYRQDGVLDSVIEGQHAAALYTPVIEKGLVSRLDHAAYLGRELARAEQALAVGTPYVQDGASEAEATSEGLACGCDSTGGLVWGSFPS